MEGITSCKKFSFVKPTQLSAYRYEVAGKPGELQDIYKQNRFDGSFHVLLIGFRTGLGLGYYLNWAGIRYSSCCNCKHQLLLKLLHKEKQIYSKITVYIIFPQTLQIPTSFASN